MEDTPTIRWMTAASAEADAPGLLALIRELAAFEGWAGQVTVTAEEIAARARLTPPPTRAVVAAAPDGALAGFATVFDIPYAYAAAPSLELEMLYVRDAWRAQGTGKAIMAAVLAHARETGCERVEWNVLASNTRAQGFYGSLGAAEKVGWRRWAITISD